MPKVKNNNKGGPFDVVKKATKNKLEKTVEIPRNQSTLEWSFSHGKRKRGDVEEVGGSDEESGEKSEDSMECDEKLDSSEESFTDQVFLTLKSSMEKLRESLASQLSSQQVLQQTMLKLISLLDSSKGSTSEKL